MPDIKEKLVALLADYYIATGVAPAQPGIADHLIANGVTIQEWISVKERLPDVNKKVLVHYESGRIEIDFRTPWNEFVLEKSQGKATHWTSVPKPPEDGNG